MTKIEQEHTGLATLDTSTAAIEALKSDIMLLEMNGEHWVTAQDYLALLAERDAAILRAEKAKTREMALREAAEACDWGDIYGDNAVKAILDLIDKGESHE